MLEDILNRTINPSSPPARKGNYKDIAEQCDYLTTFEHLCTNIVLGLDHCAHLSLSVISIKARLNCCFSEGPEFYLHFLLVQVPAVL